MLRVDASMLRDFMSCHELFRQRWIENREPKKPSIHRYYGQAVHKAIEMFHNGSNYQESVAVACSILGQLDQTPLGPKERSRYNEMWDALPEVIACYYDHVEQRDDNLMVEKEFEVFYPLRPALPLVSLCGRLDRLTSSLSLRDVKTASEIGATWKRDYKEAALRDIGISLYDWYLCQIGKTPLSIALEVLIKPYRGKPARFELIELNELIYCRQRFANNQLPWRVKELLHYYNSYSNSKPWPMNDGSQCVTKYGTCDFLPGCNYGWKEKTLSLYKIREEHLETRKISS